MTEHDDNWGETRDFYVAPAGPEDSGDLALPDWYDVVFRNVAGELHHGSEGCRLPDTVVIRFEGRAVALADAFSLLLDNQYCWDTEYYLILRVRQVLITNAWNRLPWGHLEAGDVFYAWDKFHGLDYSRTAMAEQDMSYGGDWNDLQMLIDQMHPHSAGPRPVGGVSSATLLRAVRSGDVARVRALLAAGADPNAGINAPDAALRSVSVDRDSTALWEAILAGSQPMVEALLEAGAAVNATLLQLAVVNERYSVIPLLLRFGADPDLVVRGMTARSIAASRGPEVLALFDAYPPPGEPSRSR